MRSGVVTAATSSTQARSLAFVVAPCGGLYSLIRPVHTASNARHVPWVPPNSGARPVWLKTRHWSVSATRSENGIEAGGLRDDAAVLDVPGGGPVVVSVDSVVDGVHVDLALCSPADVGWKALMGA
jgi:hypothetical protein